MEGLMRKIGVWAFILGVLLALVIGILSTKMTAYMGLISAIMVVLGLIVGLLNVAEKEVTNFIIAAIGLATGSLAIANLGPILGGNLGSIVQTMFSVFGVFVAGAVFFPALKAVYRISKD